MNESRVLFLTPASAVTRVFPYLREVNIEAAIAENMRGVLAFVQKTPPVCIFSRPFLPGFRIEELLEHAAKEENFPPIIVVTDTGSSEEAQKLMEAGAHDYWLEPITAEKIFALTREPKFAPVEESKQTTKQTTKVPHIVGSGSAMQRVLALSKQVAPSKATVLISGESGTGKEMFSRNIHAWSDRAAAPFIAINCAALPEHLLESELFGHEKGSFTGAIARKLGKFELANNGTLLLDEISEMDLSLQAKLLRVLQEGEIDRVGGTETIKIDVRIIATTNRDLEKWVEAGKFRQDLYFRLNVIPLRLPSLKERNEDVLELANFFLDFYSKEYKISRGHFSEEAIVWLKQYTWPGNVRELQNLMERAILLAGGKEIVSAHFLLDPDNWPLFGDMQQVGDDSNIQSAHSDVPAGQSVGQNAEEAQQASPSVFEGALMPLHEVERLMIKKGLEQTSGNRTQTADILGISVRTLRNKLNEYRESGRDVE